MDETWNKSWALLHHGPKAWLPPTTGFKARSLILLKMDLTQAGGRIQSPRDEYLAWTLYITDLQQENTRLPHLFSQGQCMSQDVICVVPHTSSIIFRRAAHTPQTCADQLMPTSSNTAMPTEVRTVDPTIPVKLHSCWKNLFCWWTVGIFTALRLCYTATFILRPLCQYTACYSRLCKALI